MGLAAELDRALGLAGGPDGRASGRGGSVTRPDDGAALVWPGAFVLAMGLVLAVRSALPGQGTPRWDDRDGSDGPGRPVRDGDDRRGDPVCPLIATGPP